MKPSVSVGHVSMAKTSVNSPKPTGGFANAFPPHFNPMNIQDKKYIVSTAYVFKDNKDTIMLYKISSGTTELSGFKSKEIANHFIEKYLCHNSQG